MDNSDSRPHRSGGPAGGPGGDRTAGRTAGRPGRLGPLDLVIVTGMSGAGRSTAAKVLEDLGWYVVDNLPPELLPTMLELRRPPTGDVARMAAVVDVRSRAFFSDLRRDRRARDAAAYPRMVFLEASDDVLVRRFESVRRPHPLQGDGRMVDGIARERELLRDLARRARTWCIDTSELNVHELRAEAHQGSRRRPRRACGRRSCRSASSTGVPWTPTWSSTCGSCPTRTGCRSCARRPAWTQRSASTCWRRTPPRSSRTGSSRASNRCSRATEREGKRYVTIAIGCTGGKHRSVAMAMAMARRLEKLGVQVGTLHRDLGRE